MQVAQQQQLHLQSDQNNMAQQQQSQVQNVQSKCEYKRIKTLGQGSYGKAFLVQRSTDNSYCVIKQINMTSLTEEEKKDAMNEATLLQRLDHQNIIKHHEHYKTKSGKLCIVMDYAEGGDLNNEILKASGNIPEDLVINWLSQLTSCLQYIHEQNIIHRDIKPQNVFLTKDKIVKLADFGISRVLASTKDKARTFIGTPYSLAPEQVDGKAYSTSADIWSLGVLAYFLCAQKQPFDAESMPALMKKITQGVYPPLPSIYSKELRNLISEMLTCNPSNRPSARNILDKPLMKCRLFNIGGDNCSQKQLRQDNQMENNEQQRKRHLANIPSPGDNQRNSQGKGRPHVYPGARFFSPQSIPTQNEVKSKVVNNKNSEKFIKNQEKAGQYDLPLVEGQGQAPKLINKQDKKIFKAPDDAYYRPAQYAPPDYQNNKKQMHRVDSFNEQQNLIINSNNDINNNISNQNENIPQNGKRPQQFRVHSPQNKIGAPQSRLDLKKPQLTKLQQPVELLPNNQPETQQQQVQLLNNNNKQVAKPGQIRISSPGSKLPQLNKQPSQLSNIITKKSINTPNKQECFSPKFRPPSAAVNSNLFAKNQKQDLAPHSPPNAFRPQSQHMNLRKDILGVQPKIGMNNINTSMNQNNNIMKNNFQLNNNQGEGNNQNVNSVNMQSSDDSKANQLYFQKTDSSQEESSSEEQQSQQQQVSNNNNIKKNFVINKRVQQSQQSSQQQPQQQQGIYQNASVQQPLQNNNYNENQRIHSQPNEDVSIPQQRIRSHHLSVEMSQQQVLQFEEIQNDDSPDDGSNSIKNFNNHNSNNKKDQLLVRSTKKLEETGNGIETTATQSGTIEQSHQMMSTDPKAQTREIMSDDDIRAFDSTDSHKSTKSTASLIQMQQQSTEYQIQQSQQSSQQSYMQQAGFAQLKSSNSYKQNSFNNSKDKETKCERKIIYKLPFNESKDKKKNRLENASDQKRISCHQELQLSQPILQQQQQQQQQQQSQQQQQQQEPQELDLEKVLNQLNLMMTGNIENQLNEANYAFSNNNNTLKMELDDVSKPNFLNDQYFLNNNTSNILSSTLLQDNFSQIHHPLQQSNQKLTIKNLLEREIGTFHFSKVYKMAVSSLSHFSQSECDTKEFGNSMREIFPSISARDISRYAFLFSQLISLERN